MRHISLFLLISLVSWSCSIQSQEITYGKDACHFCKMNIVDQQHASEIVSKKGKVFKYDSIECLLQDEENNQTEKVALYLVMDYYKPNSFIDASKAIFLISENVPSPMGAYLSALSSKESADKLQADERGNLYTWEEIQNQF
ncbi:MAG: copper chaperone NosL [Arcticibacterium sp.]|jgi:copper chaperone NosL